MVRHGKATLTIKLVARKATLVAKRVRCMSHTIADVVAADGHDHIVRHTVLCDAPLNTSCRCCRCKAAGASTAPIVLQLVWRQLFHIAHINEPAAVAVINIWRLAFACVM